MSTCATPGCALDAQEGWRKCCISCMTEPAGVHLSWCRLRNNLPDPASSDPSQTSTSVDALPAASLVESSAQKDTA